MQSIAMHKKHIHDLGILGGQPSFRNVLHVGRPNIGSREQFLTRVNNLLDRRWLTNDGPYVRELESRLSEYLGVKHCIAMCNATVALEITARALGLKGEVILPSFTFVASAHALQWQEITPVFCDIDPHTHNINPEEIEKHITPRTSGILGVHVWGRACEVETLREIANRHHLRLMYDAAHAFAGSHQRKMIGNFGDAEVFSFHATKFFNTFEGGAVTTNDDSLAQKIRNMRNFGFAGIDSVTELGINGKMSEISAAMGLTSLDSLDDIIAINFHHYKTYKQGLKDIPGITLVKYDEKEKYNYQYVVIEVDEKNSILSRDILVNILHAENVFARRYFYPGVHQMEPYRSYFPHAGLLLPETENMTQKVMQLPTGTAIGDEEIQAICQVVRFSVGNAVSILKKIKSRE
jgi:dTDP-4-amino-4,6-dideoxygalactose transaminase